jgi:ribosomal protein S18 acetylase RimI-like enzyme
MNIFIVILVIAFVILGVLYYQRYIQVSPNKPFPNKTKILVKKPVLASRKRRTHKLEQKQNIKIETIPEIVPVKEDKDIVEDLPIVKPVDPVAKPNETLERESDNTVHIQSKTKAELLENKKEFGLLDSMYVNTLGKTGENYFTSLKENTRVFVAYKKIDESDEEIPVAQAGVLVLDEHDFGSAFSKIRSLNLEPNSLILYNVCVDFPYRRQGIAQQLLTEVHKFAISIDRPNMVLFVNKDNIGAMTLYKRFGYDFDSKAGTSGDELMMRAKLF